MSWLDDLLKRIQRFYDYAELVVSAESAATSHPLKEDLSHGFEEASAITENYPWGPDKYFKGLISTQPCDRDKTAVAIAQLYKSIGEPPPAILWVRSPGEGARVASLLLWTLASNFGADDPLLLQVEDCSSRFDNLQEVTLSRRMHSAHEPRGVTLNSGNSIDFVQLVFDRARRNIVADLDADTAPADAWSEALRVVLESDLPVDLKKEVDATALLMWLLPPGQQRQIVDAVASDVTMGSDSVIWELDIVHHVTSTATWTLCLLDVVFPGAIQTSTTSLWSAQSDFGYWWPLKGVAVVCERPDEVHINASERLHKVGGAAISWSDGFGIYAINGQQVDRKVAMREFVAADIDGEDNLELRRVMIDAYGAESYLRETGAKAIHKDRFGTLFRKDVRDDEPIIMVEVENATAEPDGSFKKYFIRVPPDVRSARQAVAWTFELETENYDPAKET